MKITAVITARNESRYLRVTLRHLADCGIQLALIDHESTDDSLRICSEFKSHVVHQSSMPYDGSFSLTRQLEVKGKVIAGLDSDWIIHQDADEILESSVAGETLRGGIERAAREGHDVINFDEFIFLPTRQAPSFEATDFHRSMLHYYFFAPKPQRLMRAWRKAAGITQVAGGHEVRSSGRLRILPQSFILRHYIVLSQAHATTKYGGRVFSSEDLKKGWHKNRLNFPRDVALPDEKELWRLESWDRRDFNRSRPRRRHFWEPDWLTA